MSTLNFFQKKNIERRDKSNEKKRLRCEEKENDKIVENNASYQLEQQKKKNRAAIGINALIKIKEAIKIKKFSSTSSGGSIGGSSSSSSSSSSNSCSRGPSRGEEEGEDGDDVTHDWQTSAGGGGDATGVLLNDPTLGSGGHGGAALSLRTSMQKNLFLSEDRNISNSSCSSSSGNNSSGSNSSGSSSSTHIFYSHLHLGRRICL